MQLDVAVGHGAKRSGTDDRARPAAKWRVAIVDFEVDDDLAVRRDLEALDGPGLRAADLDEVALDELAGVEEAGVDGVAAAGVSEYEQRDQRDGDCRRCDGRDARDLAW
jgi:hypothetical protein